LPTASWIACTAAALAFGDVEADRKRAQQIVEREGVQTKLEYGELNREDFDMFPGGGGFKLPFSLSTPSVGDLGTTALYVGLAAVATVVLLAVGRSIMRRREQSVVAASNFLRAVAGATPDRSADELFSDADRLASEERWGDAVHSLLLAVIRGLSDEFGPARKSRTSRELIAHFKLGSERRAAFRRLVATVERVVFGDQAVDEEVFHRCRGYAAAARGVAS
jgi:hypothetical protein